MIFLGAIFAIIIWVILLGSAGAVHLSPVVLPQHAPWWPIIDANVQWALNHWTW